MEVRAESIPGFDDSRLAQRRDKAAAHFALLALVLAVLVRTAWMSDDADITFRCVMNFIHGYGPTFNIDERVQAFTHPLWFILISVFTLLFGNVFAAAFALSIFFSLITWWLLTTRLATSFWPGMLAGTSLLLSKAFVDYSTSGLENPLSHFILVLGLILGFRWLKSSRGDARSLRNCLGEFALIYLSRPDLVLLVFPFCLVLLWTSQLGLRDTAKVIAVAISPELLWTLFSLFYYGAPFPNTAYAKLGSGIPAAETTRQGLVICLSHSQGTRSRFR